MRTLVLVAALAPFVAGAAAADSLAAAESVAVADRVTLANGDVLSGTILERTDEVLVLEHPQLGRLELPATSLAEADIAAAIAAADTAAADSAAVADAAGAAEAVPPPPGLFGTSFLAGWKRSLSAGVTGAAGQSRELSIQTALKGDYEDAEDRWDFDTAYFFDSSNGVVGTNKLFVALNKDWLRPGSRWFWFARTRYDNDEFADWDHRITAAAGPGYDFVKNETWHLRGRLGLGGVRTFGGEQDQFGPEVGAGLETKWNITSKTVLEAGSTYYQPLLNLDEWRVLSSVDWVFALEAFEGFHLKFGVQHEYDAGAPDEPQDLNYVGGLGLDF
jgi:putative salt-induced outer membrane protein YdiY